MVLLSNTQASTLGKQWSTSNITPASPAICTYAAILLTHDIPKLFKRQHDLSNKQLKVQGHDINSMVEEIAFYGESQRRSVRELMALSAALCCCVQNIEVVEISAAGKHRELTGDWSLIQNRLMVDFGILLNTVVQRNFCPPWRGLEWFVTSLGQREARPWHAGVWSIWRTYASQER